MSDQDALTPRVLLVRHGETEWAKVGRYKGITEIDLTPKGIAHISSTAVMLVGRHKLLDPTRIAQVFVSPRERAQTTYKLLFGAYDMQQKVTQTSAIAEWNYGLYEGLTIKEIKERRSENNLDSDKEWNIWRDGCEGGESKQQVTEWLSELISEIRKIQSPHMAGETPGDVVLVAHGLILRCFVKLWLGHPLDYPIHMTLNPGAVAILRNGNIDEPSIHLGLTLLCSEEGTRRVSQDGTLRR